MFAKCVLSEWRHIRDCVTIIIFHLFRDNIALCDTYRVFQKKKKIFQYFAIQKCRMFWFHHRGILICVNKTNKEYILH